MVAPPTEPGKVLFGKGGWLFLQQDTNDVIGQHTSRVRMGRENCRAWKQVLAGRIALAERLGVTWLCQISPDKESIYPENLPTRIVPARRRPVHEFLGIAESVEAPVVYPIDELLSAKREAELYSRTDTHWNQRGSYVAYRSLCRNLAHQGLSLPRVDETTIRWKSEPALGDLGSKLHPPRRGTYVRAELERHSARLVFDNRVHNHGRVMIFDNATGPDLSCVAFGESFANHLLLFLKESFRRLVFVHSNMLISEVLEREHPDVVLTLPLERFLVRVPSDDGGLVRLAESVEGKLSRGEIQERPTAYLRDCPQAEAASEDQLGALPW
jgi:SGNH hydrolase-like domain, acetyltransferase AlgX